MEGSRRYDSQRYEELINNYINHGSTELRNLVLTGNELLDFADALRSIKDYHEEYKEIEENHKKLIKNIEDLFKGKEGSLVKKVMTLVNNSKKDSG